MRSSTGGDIGLGDMCRSCCCGEKPSPAVFTGVAFITRIGGACNLNGDAVVFEETGVAETNVVGELPCSAAEYASMGGALFMVGKPGVLGVCAKPGVLGADCVRSCAR